MTLSPSRKSKLNWNRGHLSVVCSHNIACSVYGELFPSAPSLPSVAFCPLLSDCENREGKKVLFYIAVYKYIERVLDTENYANIPICTGVSIYDCGYIFNSHWIQIVVRGYISVGTKHWKSGKRTVLHEKYDILQFELIRSIHLLFFKMSSKNNSNNQPQEIEKTVNESSLQYLLCGNWCTHLKDMCLKLTL